jgi:dihydropyrimidinase
MRVDYNPYEGMTIPGSPAYVFSRGNLVFDGDTFVGKAGSGQFLKRSQYSLP